MSLPSGYKRLEYIQSSGTQYIDTKVKPTVNTKFSFGVYMLEQTGDCIIGNFLNDNNDYRIFNYSGSIYWDFKDSRIIGTAGSFPKNTYCEFECGNNYVKKNGQQVLTGQNISAFTADANIFAFSNGVSARCSGRLYFLEIFDGESLIRDFVPCINGSGEVGLYDLVSKQFFGNAGTGTFTAGPVIAIAVAVSEVTELEYIQSSGTQYIDTNVSAPEGFRITCDVEFTSLPNTLNMLFGSHDAASPYYRNFLAATNTGKWEIGAYNPTDFGSVSINTKYSIDVCTISGAIGCSINGIDQIVDSSIAASTIRSSRTIYVFGLNYPDGLLPSNMKLYGLKMYLDADGSNLVRDFVPCIKDDGTVGLYDLVGKQFYGNAGTGVFTGSEGA